MNCEHCGSSSQEIGQMCHGLPAYPGCVEGRVRVVNLLRDLGAVLPGDVLVTPMTHPDVVGVLGHCVAVVTDRGGVLCHAAIVCREMKIPCIVGTGDATKSLSDGMIIRVCASRGIVFAAKAA